MKATDSDLISHIFAICIHGVNITFVIMCYQTNLESINNYSTCSSHLAPPLLSSWGMNR